MNMLYPFGFDGSEILVSDLKKFKLLMQKSFLIKLDKPMLNTIIKLLSLKLFDSEVRNCLQILLLMSSNFKRIN